MTQKLFPTFLLIIFVFGACTPVYYRANPQNIPLLQAKGDMVLTGGLSSGSVLTGSASFGFDAQYAQALTNQWGVMANISSFKGVGGVYIPSGYLAEGGGGYFHPFGSGFVFECYGGIGIGSVDNRSSTPDTLKVYRGNSVHLVRLFVQPSIGYSSKHFEAAFSIRLCGMQYYGGSYDLRDSTNLDSYQYLTTQKWIGSIEPALTIKLGSDRVKYFWQQLLVKPLSNDIRFLYTPSTTLVGIQFRL